jgi:hypothetical protein
VLSLDRCADLHRADLCVHHPEAMNITEQKALSKIQDEIVAASSAIKLPVINRLGSPRNGPYAITTNMAMQAIYNDYHQDQ